jgi:hypothetical protein
MAELSHQGVIGTQTRHKTEARKELLRIGIIQSLENGTVSMPDGPIQAWKTYEREYRIYQDKFYQESFCNEHERPGFIVCFKSIWDRNVRLASDKI